MKLPTEYPLDVAARIYARRALIVFACGAGGLFIGAIVAWVGE
jgi:hypothetical protein